MPKRSTPQKPDAKPALTAPKGGKPAGARPSARGVALELLTEVLEKKRPLDELLDGNRGLAALEPRDRAFAYLMTATVLRRLGQIDALIAHALARPLPAKAATAQNLLRLGIAQLLFLKVPAHAAVGETVELAEAMNWGGFKGLINAVLRRLGAEGEAILAAQDAPRLNTPDWLWQSWSQAYGEAAARDIAAACLEEPPLDLTVKANAQGWAAELEAELLPTGTLRRRTGGDVKALPGFAEGAWWVQDAAAALPARMLGDVAGKRVLDLCAAPGGKTAQLALAGAKVTALERSAHRLRRLAENLARLRLSAELVAADVRAVATRGAGGRRPPRRALHGNGSAPASSRHTPSQDARRRDAHGGRAGPPPQGGTGHAPPGRASRLCRVLARAGGGAGAYRRLVGRGRPSQAASARGERDQRARGARDSRGRSAHAAVPSRRARRARRLLRLPTRAALVLAIANA